MCLLYFHTVSCRAASTCLAPGIIDGNDNPDITRIVITNTSVEIWWIEPDVPECCYDIVFSYPPVMYTYRFNGGKLLQSEVCRCMNVSYECCLYAPTGLCRYVCTETHM